MNLNKNETKVIDETNIKNTKVAKKKQTNHTTNTLLPNFWVVKRERKRERERERDREREREQKQEQEKKTKINKKQKKYNPTHRNNKITK